MLMGIVYYVPPSDAAGFPLLLLSLERSWVFFCISLPQMLMGILDYFVLKMLMGILTTSLLKMLMGIRYYFAP